MLIGCRVFLSGQRMNASKPVGKCTRMQIAWLCLVHGVGC